MLTVRHVSHWLAGVRHGVARQLYTSTSCQLQTNGCTAAAAAAATAAAAAADDDDDDDDST